MDETAFFMKKILPLLTNRKRKKKVKAVLGEFVTNLRSKCNTQAPHLFYSGSYGRKTELADSDVDIFLVMNEHNNEEGINALYDRVQTLLARLYPKNTKRPQEHTIMIKIKEVCIEVIPALPHSDEWYQIPEGDDSIISCPAVIKQKIKETNKSSSGVFSQLVRTLKYWKKQNNLRLKSFYIETHVLEWYKARGIKSMRLKELPIYIQSILKSLSLSVRQQQSSEYYQDGSPLTGVCENEKRHLFKTLDLCTALIDEIEDFREKGKKEETVAHWRMIFNMN